MKIYIAILFIFLTNCNHQKKYDERLLGVWKSNKKETVERFIKTHPAHVKKMGNEKFKKFKALFGKLEITYTATECKAKLNDFETINKYSIVEQGDDYIILKHEDENIKENEFIKFVDGGYWLKPHKNSNFMEKFDRVEGGLD